MLSLGSNIPSNNYYASIETEILRFFRSTLGSNTFIASAKQLLTVMKNTGSKHRSILSMLKKNL